MTIGIYVLYFENDDGMYYVGQSDNIEIRYKEHCTALDKGTHHSRLLQKYYDVYKHYPVQSVLEKCPVLLLNEREVHWISLFDSYMYGFNGTVGGCGLGRGEQHPSAQISNSTAVHIILELAHTDKTMRSIAKELNISERIINGISEGRNFRFLEEEYPQEYAKMRAKVGTRNIHTHQQDLYVCIMLELANTSKTPLEISTEFNISKIVVKQISEGTTHKYLAVKFPEDYARMRAKVGTRKGTTVHTLKDPEGVTHYIKRGEVKLFCAKYALDPSAISKVCTRKQKSHKEWTLYDPT